MPMLLINLFKKNRMYSRSRLMSSGFTLIEILVVMGIFGLVTYGLLNNVLRSRVNIKSAARVVMSDIRQAQANSLSSKQYAGVHRCGYGIAPDTSSPNSSYFFYASNPVPANGNCGGNGGGNWQYNPQQDTPIILTRILDPRLELFDPSGNPKPNFEDITFESYNGNIHINNLHRPNNQSQNRSQIGIRKKGTTVCTPETCIFVCIYAFGRIQTRSTECASCQGDPLTCPN